MTELIDERKAFLTGLWHLEDLPRPAYQITRAVQHETTMLERFQDPQKTLVAQLKEFEANLCFRSDYVPAFFPYLGTGVFASAFGCQIEWFEERDPWALPIISDDPQRVYELEPPAVTDGLLGRALEMTAYFREKTDGRYPIRMTDLQSPLDTASLIWKSDQFLMAMYTAPREVHYLLELVTDLIIRFVRRQRDVAGDFIPLHFPFVWMPDDYGIGVSEDLLALISPALFDEFALPYNNRLSEEFGGLVIHSCGNFVHNLDGLAKIKDLRAINFGATETPFSAVAKKFSGQAAIIPHIGLNRDIRFDSVLDYVESVLRQKKTNRGLFIIMDIRPGYRAYPMQWHEGDEERIYALIEKYS